MSQLAAIALLLAAPAEEAPPKPVVVVANIRVVGDIAGVEVLSEELRTQIARHGAVRLATPEELSAVDAELTRQLEGGCDDATCVAEIGGAVGAQFVITGQIGKLGELYNLNLKLVDIETVSARRATSRRNHRVEEFLEAIPSMVDELLIGTRPSGSPGAPAGGAVARVDKAVKDVGKAVRASNPLRGLGGASSRVSKSIRKTVRESNSVDTRWSALLSVGFPQVTALKLELRPWRWLQFELDAGVVPALGIRVPFSGRLGRGVSYSVVLRQHEDRAGVYDGIERVRTLMMARQGRSLFGRLTVGTNAGVGVIQKVVPSGETTFMWELGFDIGLSGSRVKR